ncbi:MAG: Yip1 family protein [Anaerolineales bacterium]
MNTMIDRVLRAAKLDVDFFKEAEADPSLNQEALMVIVLVSAISAVGSFISGLMGGKIGAALIALIITVILGVVNYYIWGYLTHFIGSSLFDATSEPGEVLRVLGYASGPRVLGFFSFIPCVGGLVGLIGAIWALVAGFIGVREALDLDTGKTLITVIIGWAVIMIITFAVSSIIGVGSLGLTSLLTR